jgi:hypothetical protein
MNTNNKTLDFKKVILPTIFEYLVIFLPVAFYVGLESQHKGAYYFIKSPEWAIVSIFLGFQSVFLYFRYLGTSGKKPNFDFLGILILALVTITIVATLNAYASLDEIYNTMGKVILRLALLTISSISFFLLVFASKSENIY